MNDPLDEDLKLVTKKVNKAVELVCKVHNFLTLSFF